MGMKHCCSHTVCKFFTQIRTEIMVKIKGDYYTNFIKTYVKYKEDEARKSRCKTQQNSFLHISCCNDCHKQYLLGIAALHILTMWDFLLHWISLVRKDRWVWCCHCYPSIFGQWRETTFFKSIKLLEVWLSRPQFCRFSFYWSALISLIMEIWWYQAYLNPL